MIIKVHHDLISEYSKLYNSKLEDELLKIYFRIQLLEKDINDFESEYSKII